MILERICNTPEVQVLMKILQPLSNPLKLYLSHAPNTTSVDFTVKCLLTSP
jgi:hypothetical protein